MLLALGGAARVHEEERAFVDRDQALEGVAARVVQRDDAGALFYEATGNLCRGGQVAREVDLSASDGGEDGVGISEGAEGTRGPRGAETGQMKVAMKRGVVGGVSADVGLGGGSTRDGDRVGEGASAFRE